MDMSKIYQYRSEYDHKPLDASVMYSPDLRLIKFCDERHNIARGVCSTILVGTTQYYREMESTDERADNTEGHGAFMQNWSSPDGGYRMFNNIVVPPLLPNAYLYCTSMDDKEKFKHTNADKFYINNPNKFYLMLQHLLAAQLRKEDLVDSTLLSPPIGIDAYARDVRYGKVFDHTTMEFLDRKALLEITFRKPLKYGHEREVRFAYYIFKDVSKDGKVYRNILDLKKAPKLIDITPLKNEFDKIVSLQ